MTKHNETLEALKRMSEEDPDGFSNDILALIDYKCETAKAEAHKEFAERLETKLFIEDNNWNPVVTKAEIDETYKELVGDK